MSETLRIERLTAKCRYDRLTHGQKRKTLRKPSRNLRTRKKNKTEKFLRRKVFLHEPIVNPAIEKRVVHRVAHREKVTDQIDHTYLIHCHQVSSNRKDNKVKLLRKPEENESIRRNSSLHSTNQQMPKMRTIAINIFTTRRFD